MICGECGCYFGAKVWHSTAPYRTVMQVRGAQRCHSTHVREDDIKEGVLRVMMEIIPRKSADIATCQHVLNETMETESVERKLEALKKQEESLHRQIEGIVGEFARATIEKAVYDREYGELHGQYEAVVAKITKMEGELSDECQRRRRVELLSGCWPGSTNRWCMTEACSPHMWTGSSSEESRGTPNLSTSCGTALRIPSK